MVLPLQAQLQLEAFSDRIFNSLKWASAFILDQSPTTLQNYMLSSLVWDTSGFGCGLSSSIPSYEPCELTSRQ